MSISVSSKSCRPPYGDVESIVAVLFYESDKGFRNKRGVIRPEASPSTHPSVERAFTLATVAGSTGPPHTLIGHLPTTSRLKEAPGATDEIRSG